MKHGATPGQAHSSGWTAALLQWYAQHARSFPWREHPTPYAVLVSEFMLQQTRTETVREYFTRWMARFPDLASLAQADEADVLRLWEGLGYYRRARQLHQTAQRIMTEHQGRIPDDPAQLQRLPGIGPYTAAAIAAIAYNRPVLALDGNLKRVLARFFGVDHPIQTPRAARELRERAEPAIPAGQSAAFNQALMDLGAQVCTPRQPRCEACPLRPWCRAFHEGKQHEWPRRQPRKAIPHYLVVAGVWQRGDQVFLAQRPADAMLGGLWEFPGGKVKPGESLEDALRREWREELAVEIVPGPRLGTFRHAYSHFRITLHALRVVYVQGEPQPLYHQKLAWVPLDQLDQYPMGKVDRAIAQRLREEYRQQEARA
ncbi:MAG: A/G-specific adenine glycosylase [Chloroflexi bacterium]|nr:A/G-specific adenine glycosylase [Chloroflexota bacterium]